MGIKRYKENTQVLFKCGYNWNRYFLGILLRDFVTFAEIRNIDPDSDGKIYDVPKHHIYHIT